MLYRRYRVVEMGYRAHTGLFQGVIRAVKTPMMWGTAGIFCGWHCAEGEENVDSLKSNKPTVKVGKKADNEVW